MRQQAPVDTGRLRSNIEAQTTLFNTVEVESVAIDPETGEDYAYVQEHGSRHVRAQPYFNKNIAWWKRTFERTLRELLRAYTSLGSSHKARNIRRGR